MLNPYPSPKTPILESSLQKDSQYSSTLVSDLSTSTRRVGCKGSHVPGKSHIIRTSPCNLASSSFARFPGLRQPLPSLPPASHELCGSPRQRCALRQSSALLKQTGLDGKICRDLFSTISAAQLIFILLSDPSSPKWHNSGMSSGLMRPCQSAASWRNWVSITRSDSSSADLALLPEGVPFLRGYIDLVRSARASPYR